MGMLYLASGIDIEGRILLGSTGQIHIEGGTELWSQTCFEYSCPCRRQLYGIPWYNQSSYFLHSYTELSSVYKGLV